MVRVVTARILRVSQEVGSDWRAFLEHTVGPETGFFEPLTKGLGVAARSDASEAEIVAYVGGLLAERAKDDPGRRSRYGPRWVTSTVARFRRVDQRTDDEIEQTAAAPVQSDCLKRGRAMVAEKSNRRLFEERDPGSGRRGEEGTGSWDKWDEAAARSAKKEKVKTELPADVSIDDFRAFMPTHTYIYLPLRDFWPAASVNARVPLVGTGQYDEDGEEITIKASTWLDQEIGLASRCPGSPAILRSCVISSLRKAR